MKSIKFYITALLLMVCGMANAQVAEPYLNVKLEDGSFRSFQVTPNLEISWGKNMQELSKEFTVDLDANPKLEGKIVTIVLDNGSTYKGTIGTDGKLDIMLREEDRGHTPTQILYGHDSNGNPIVPTTQGYVNDVNGGYDQSAMPLVGSVDPVTGNVTFTPAGAVAKIPGQTITAGSTGVTLTYTVNDVKKTITLDGVPTGTDRNLGFVIEPGATGLVLDRGDHTGFATIKPEPTFTAGSTPSITGCDWVQLLENGPKWATVNVGVTDGKPESYGLLYAWGETTGYYGAAGHSFSPDNYTFCDNGDMNRLNKYCTNSKYGTVDNKTTLEKTDDAAYVNMGSLWRMPTQTEMQSLIDNCTSTNETQNEVTVRKFTGSYNTFIFFPYAGDATNMEHNYAGIYGSYWTSTLSSYDKYGMSFQFQRDYPENSTLYGYNSRYYGQSVRAVLNEE